MSVAAGLLATAAVMAGATTPHVTVDVEVRGAIREHLHGSHGRAALYSCTHDGTRYTLRFGNDDGVALRRGVFLSFAYDATRSGRQALRNARLFVELSRFRAVSLPQSGWSGSVTLGASFRSGRFQIEGARPVMASGRVSVTGSWSCSSVIRRTR